MPNVVIATLSSHYVLPLARVPLVGERVHVPQLVHDARVRVVVHTPHADVAAVVYVVQCTDDVDERLRARTHEIVESVRLAEPTSHRDAKRAAEALRR